MEIIVPIADKHQELAVKVISFCKPLDIQTMTTKLGCNYDWKEQFKVTRRQVRHKYVDFRR